MNSFRIQLLFVFALLTAVAIGATTYAVFEATERSIARDTQKELDTAQRVFLSIIEDRSKQLLERTIIVASDFGLKKAIATGETDTAVSALANHGERARASLVALLGTDGRVRAASHDFSVHSNVELAAGNSGPLVRFVVAESGLYQVAFVPVMAPNMLGWVALGYQLDSVLMDSIKEITEADITFLFSSDALPGDDRSPGVRTEIITTLPTTGELTTPLSTAIEQQSLELATSTLAIDLASRQWFTQRLEFSDQDQNVVGLVSKSLTARLADFGSLKRQILMIAAAALALSLAAAVLFARNLSRPIEELVRAAMRIASGDYRPQADVRAALEFRQLGSALQTMSEAISEREKRIKFQAEHDLLTLLPNRDFISRLVNLRTVEHGPPASYGLALMRLTNIEPLTDIYGQQFIDELLLQFAGRTRSIVRRGDVVARIDSDCFLVFCDDLKHEGLDALFGKLLNMVSAAFLAQDVEVRLELSIGAVISPEHGCGYDELLRRAHIALKLAEFTRNGAGVYQLGMDERHLRQIKITNRLQLALQSSGFELHYQPKVEAVTGRCMQVEALLRWTDSEMGKMFPDEFIPLAEHSGDIVLITDWVIEEVIRQQLVWRAEGRHIVISINLSAHDILSPHLSARLDSKMLSAGLPPACLHLEITESAIINDPATAIAQLTRLRSMGFVLSMDDFGTGYSSLSQLKNLPVNEVKIDKSFILKLDEDSIDQRLVRSIIHMGHNLELSVVAEGVENEASANLLRDWGCEYLQGYWFSRPIPAAELEVWLDSRQAIDGERITQ